jgi:hypothetical protein
MTPDDFNTVFNLPFNEASAFFRNKLNIPTKQWDDLWKGEHAKGFMSAGAMKAELLTDLSAEVDKAIAGGLTKKEFLEQFDSIVAKHGWSYNGGRRWRSNLIYDTNVTTAYQAGRWKQFQEGGAQFLMYIHADGVRHPRPQHVAWHGVTLPISHEFWSTHYPPNGWRCHCRAVRAGAAEVTAPPAGYRNIDPKTGAMVGIDKGWDYNVGAAGAEPGYSVLTKKFETLPPEIAKQWMAQFVKEPAFARFISGEIKGNFPVAVLDEAARKAIGAESQTAWLSDDSLSKNKGLQPERSNGHPELTVEEYRLLPKVIGDPLLVVEKEGYKEVFAGEGRGFYLAVVKTTKGKDELFVQSYRRASISDLQRERKTGNVIFDKMKK